MSDLRETAADTDETRVCSWPHERTWVRVRAKVRARVRVRVRVSLSRAVGVGWERLGSEREEGLVRV